LKEKDNKIGYVTQGDSSREKEINEKYKEENNETEANRYEKKYNKKMASKCEGESLRNSHYHQQIANSYLGCGIVNSPLLIQKQIKGSKYLVLLPA